MLVHGRSCMYREWGSNLETCSKWILKNVAHLGWLQARGAEDLSLTHHPGQETFDSAIYELKATLGSGAARLIVLGKHPMEYSG